MVISFHYLFSLPNLRPLPLPARSRDGAHETFPPPWLPTIPTSSPRRGSRSALSRARGRFNGLFPFPGRGPMYSLVGGGSQAHTPSRSFLLIAGMELPALLILPLAPATQLRALLSPGPRSPPARPQPLSERLNFFFLFLPPLKICPFTGKKVFMLSLFLKYLGIAISFFSPFRRGQPPPSPESSSTPRFHFPSRCSSALYSPNFFFSPPLPRCPFSRPTTGAQLTFFPLPVQPRQPP